MTDRIRRLLTSLGALDAVRTDDRMTGRDEDQDGAKDRDSQERHVVGSSALDAADYTLLLSNTRLSCIPSWHFA